MAGRYIETKVIDYCYRPLHIVKDGRDVVVPCGKCNGCLLHKANEWSMRCAMEIEDTPATIFGTLTYSNKYIPKLVKYRNYLLSDNNLNVRYNTVCDVLREDNIIIPSVYDSIPLVNWDNERYPVIAYASKRDVQLWLKIVRKYLFDSNLFNDYGSNDFEKARFFRYYVISEIGPTTLRPHFHFLLFCKSVEIASYLAGGPLYEAWKMCDEDKFAPYLQYCNSGAGNYVTNYVTGFSNLPRVYKENKKIAPFRLASKSPAIGYIGQNKEKIFEDVSKGLIQYTRKVPRLESNPILRYPKAYLRTLFPKCYEFGQIDYGRRYNIYGYLYRAVRKYGYSYFILLERLRQVLNPLDFQAVRACWRFCKEVEPSPEYYVYLLDTYYYEVEQNNLSNWYSSMQKESLSGIEDFRWFEYYSNLEDLILSNRLYLCCPTLSQFYNFNRLQVLKLKENLKRYYDSYVKEVDDAISNSVKMPKYNELTGNAPTIV